MSLLAFPSATSALTSRFSGWRIDLPANAPATVAKKAGSRRSTGFDAARVFAALAIVVCHAVRVPAVSRIAGPGFMGTSFFAAAAMYFLVRGLRKDPLRSFPQYAQARFRRLVLPFAAWNICYFLLRMVCDHWIERRPVIAFTPSIFLLGYDNKLWFLPFIFVASLLAFPIAGFALRHAAFRGVLVMGCILAGVALCLLPQPEEYLPDTAIGTFLVRVVHVVPSALWGLAIGLAQDAEAERHWATGKFPVLAAAAISCAFLLGWMGGVTVLVRNLGGIGLMILGLSVPNARVPRTLLQLAPISFGIYLAHPLLIGCWEIMLRRLGSGVSFSNDALVCVPTLASTICGLLLGRGLSRRGRPARVNCSGSKANPIREQASACIPSY